MERIETLCKKKGLNIYKLEKEIGFKRSTIDYWKNTPNPNIKKLAEVADYFNVSVDFLLGRTNRLKLATDDSFILCKKIELLDFIERNHYSDKQAQIILNYLMVLENFWEEFN